jgi:DNA primase
MAGRIPQSFIDEIIARADIVEFIGARLPLKKAGREFKACCPFHNEKTPSFCVIPDKQFFHCFGCGAHGSVVGFLMQYEKLSFVEALEDIAHKVGLELPRETRDTRESGSGDLYEVMAQAARFFEQNLRDDERALAYIGKRAIETGTAKKFALGFAPNSWSALLTRFGGGDDERRRLLQTGLIIEREARSGDNGPGYYDRFRDRLMFPIRDTRGRVIAFGGRVLDQGDPKYMNSPETTLFHKGSELYGLYEARAAHTDFKRLLIVEGYMDVVALHQAGITYAVATLGTATTQEHLGKIFRLTSEVVFCFDGDRAGRQAAWRALENAMALARDGRELKFLFLPEGEDPDSLVSGEGKAHFEKRLQDALPLSEYFLQQLLVQVDLTHVDGRAKLAALAKPLFSKMPEGVYRELLADRLASHIGMPAAKLKELLSLGAPGTQRAPAAPAPPLRLRRVSIGRGNLLTQAITLVLHHPGAAAAVTHRAALDHVSTPGVNVLARLLDDALEAARPSTATLLERWRERPEFDRLSALAAEERMVADEAAAARELNMAVEKLVQQQGAEARVTELLRKSQETGLNSDEKAELSNLLKSRGNRATPG